MQIKSGPAGRASDRCKVLDEKYLIVPLGLGIPS